MNNDFSDQHYPAIPSAGFCLCGFADASGLGWCGNCGLLEFHDISHDFLDPLASQDFDEIVPPCLLRGDTDLNSWNPSHTLQITPRDIVSDFALATPIARQDLIAETTSHRASGTCSSMHPKAWWPQNDLNLPDSTVEPLETDPTRKIGVQDLRLLGGDTAVSRITSFHSMVSPVLGAKDEYSVVFPDSNLAQGLQPHRKDHLITLGTHDLFAQYLQS
jgi:hypothetical protein